MLENLCFRLSSVHFDEIVHVQLSDKRLKVRMSKICRQNVLFKLGLIFDDETGIGLPGDNVVSFDVGDHSVKLG